MEQKLFFLEIMEYILGGVGSLFFFKALVDQSIFLGVIGVVLIIAFVVCLRLYGIEERKVM